MITNGAIVGDQEMKRGHRFLKSVSLNLVLPAFLTLVATLGCGLVLSGNALHYFTEGHDTDPAKVQLAIFGAFVISAIAVMVARELRKRANWW